MNGSRAKKIVKMVVDDPDELIRLRILQFPVTNQGNEKEHTLQVFTVYVCVYGRIKAAAVVAGKCSASEHM